MAQHTHHDHGHEHEHDHGHEKVDYGEMYKQPWVQVMVKQIQDYLLANATWLGIDPGKDQRVLDYACGHGTISLGLMKANPNASCRGIDLDASQVQRYNDGAKKLLGNGASARMTAIHGDLYNPTDEMSAPEWNDFDLAVMSMALHHVRDPVEMLRRLKQRLRPGGTLIVVEFLGKKDESAQEEREYDPDNMVEVIGKQKIWPGFTTGNLQADLEKSGFEGLDVRVLDEPAHIPDSARGSNFGGEQWCFFAKATVPETA